MGLFGKRKAVMIIDDDMVRRKKLYDVLKLTGFDLISAINGKEAIGKIPREKPKLVVINMNSAVVFGIDFIKELRTYGMGQQITVIGMVTAEEEERKRTRAAGADDLLDQDFAPYALVELVCKYLKIEKINISEAQFEKRKEIVEELADSYRDRMRKAKTEEDAPVVQLLLPDGRDLGVLQLTDFAGKH
ncbi:MAG: response regulator [Deltaproteobacteria bacterium]|nr:response regulator [Deltaproteobacteria bacterium]